MKKILIVILTLCLFLASCSVNIREPEPETKNVGVKTEISSNEFIIIGPLPDIGEFSGNLQNDRFHDEVTYDFIPSDEYGKIIPYIGSYKVYETPKEEGSDWHTEMGYCSYGFCNPDGKIVMDASTKNTYINYRETNDGFGFYTLTREMLPVDDAPDEWLPSETYVIPLDGSWVIKLSSSSWVSNSGGGYIGVCDYPEDGSDVRTLLYDYDGNLVKTVDGVDSTGIYSNGLMLISEWTSDGYRAHFINEDGDIVFGPYSSASDFNDYGITAVTDENGAYLMNADGERLTDHYDSIFKEYSDNLEKQVFSARHDGNNKKCDVFSQSGEYIGLVEGTSYASFRFPDNGEVFYYYTYYPENEKGYPIYAEENMIYKNLKTGEDLISKEYGVGPNSYSGSDNCFVHVDKTEKVAYLFDAEGETIAKIDGASELGAVSEYGEYVIYTEGEYNYGVDELTGLPLEDTRKVHIYDSEKKEVVFTLDAPCNAYLTEDKRFIRLSVYDETDFFGGTEKCWLFDTQNGELVFENCNNIMLQFIDGMTYINVCTDNSSALYDGEFNLIRKVYYE